MQAPGAPPPSGGTPVAVMAVAAVAGAAGGDNAPMAIEQTVTGEVMEVGDDFMAVWPARWMLPIAFGMMALYHMVRIRQDVGRIGEIKVPISA